MDFALNTYMNHAGLRVRDARSSSLAEKAQAAPDKDKWLPFFPKTKKVTELLRKYLLVQRSTGDNLGKPSPSLHLPPCCLCMGRP